MRPGRTLTGALFLAMMAGPAWCQKQVSEVEAELQIRPVLLKSVRLAEETEPVIRPEQPPRRQVQMSHKLVELVSHAAGGDSFDTAAACERDALGRPDPFCGVRWRKGDALSDLRADYSRVNRKVKRSLFGSLARNIDLDLDSSPEIRFKFEFD